MHTHTHLGLTTLSLVSPRNNPFRFYRNGKREEDDASRLAADAFRSVTSLSIGVTETPAPDSLSVLFPALRHLGASAYAGSPYCNFTLWKNEHESDDVHAGVRSIDFGATGMRDQTLHKLPQRFPNLVEFVAPQVAAAHAGLASTILKWSATLATLDMSRVTPMCTGPLEHLLVGNERVDGPLAVLGRLRLSRVLQREPLAAAVADMLARRCEKLGPLAGRVAIEWVPVSVSVASQPPPPPPLFAGLANF